MKARCHFRELLLLLLCDLWRCLWSDLLPLLLGFLASLRSRLGDRDRDRRRAGDLDLERDLSRRELVRFAAARFLSSSESVKLDVLDKLSSSFAVIFDCCASTLK
jgi:hypothetical protein